MLVLLLFSVSLCLLFLPSLPVPHLLMLGRVITLLCIGLAAGTVVLSCDETWPCWLVVSACCACSVLACGAGSGGSRKAGWNPSGDEGFHGVPFTVPSICLSYLASPATLLTVRARTTLPATPTKDSP